VFSPCVCANYNALFGQISSNAMPLPTATGPPPDWRSWLDDSGIAPGPGPGPATPPFHADPHEHLVMHIATSPVETCLQEKPPSAHSLRHIVSPELPTLRSYLTRPKHTSTLSGRQLLRNEYAPLPSVPSSASDTNSDEPASPWPLHNYPPLPPFLHEARPRWWHIPQRARCRCIMRILWRVPL